MHRRLAVALLFSVCTEPLQALRVYSHVHKKNKNKLPWGQADALRQAIDKLEKQWPGNENSKLMLTEAVLAHPSFDTNFLRRKLVERMRSQQPFVFATFGSSVSAGHDNFANHSWPLQLEQILKPTFQALGFDFEVRQRAMGGYGEAPFAASCLVERAGPAVDAVAWEYHMFQDAECEVAHFCKETASMESKPALFALKDTKMDFGEYADEDGTARQKVRDEVLRVKDLENWHEQYHAPDYFFTEDFISPDEQHKYHQLSRKFRKTPTHGPAAEMVNDWNLPRIAKASEIEGFYAVVPDAHTEFAKTSPWYTARERAFNINWHPGPLGHALIASQVAHFMLTEMRKEFEGISFKVKERVEGLEQAPGAGPTADNPLVGVNAKANDLQCGTLQTQTCHTGVVPSFSPLSQWQALRSADSKDTWQWVPSSLDPERAFQQIDHRNVWRGTPEAGELQFEVEVPPGKTDGDFGYVMVCQAPCGWQCEPGSGYVSAKSQRWWPKEEHDNLDRKDVSDLEFTVNSEIVAPATLLSLHDELFHPETGKYCPGCENPANVCQPAAKLSSGVHKIGMKVKPQSYQPVYPEKMHVDVLEVLVIN